MQAVAAMSSRKTSGFVVAAPDPVVEMKLLLQRQLEIANAASIQQQRSADQQQHLPEQVAKQ